MVWDSAYIKHDAMCPRPPGGKCHRQIDATLHIEVNSYTWIWINAMNVIGESEG